MTETFGHLDIPLDELGDDVWRVAFRRFEDADAARERWEHAQDAIAGNGNYSAWRVLNPATGEWLVVYCGRPADLPAELGGVPVPVDFDTAIMYAIRRARVLTDAEAVGADTALQVARYGEDAGRVIEPDGTTRPATASEYGRARGGEAA